MFGNSKRLSVCQKLFRFSDNGGASRCSGERVRASTGVSSEDDEDEEVWDRTKRGEVGVAPSSSLVGGDESGDDGGGRRL